MVGTNELESKALSDQELVTTYKDQSGVERGFRGSRKIPCFWPPRSQSRNRSASSRLSFDHGALLDGLSLSRISAAGTPGYNRADHSRSSRLADRTSDDAALVFQCFEGIELLHVQTSTTSLTIVLRLEAVHRLILALLGPPYEKISHPSG